VIIKDTDSRATVAVWDSMVNTIEKGECVQITKCRVRLFNGEKRLTTTRSSQCEVCCSNKGLDPLQRGDNYKNVKMEWGLIKSLSPEPLGQF
jgi:hypothetical protein